MDVQHTMQYYFNGCLLFDDVILMYYFRPMKTKSNWYVIFKNIQKQLKSQLFWYGHPHISY